MPHTPCDAAVRELRQVYRDLATATLDTAAHVTPYTAALISGTGGGASDLNNLPSGHLHRLRTEARFLAHATTRVSKPRPPQP